LIRNKLCGLVNWFDKTSRRTAVPCIKQKPFQFTPTASVNTASWQISSRSLQGECPLFCQLFASMRSSSRRRRLSSGCDSVSLIKFR
jgi:hypothetical protein